MNQCDKHRKLNFTQQQISECHSHALSKCKQSTCSSRNDLFHSTSMTKSETRYKKWFVDTREENKDISLCDTFLFRRKLVTTSSFFKVLFTSALAYVCMFRLILLFFFCGPCFCPAFPVTHMAYLMICCFKRVFWFEAANLTAGEVNVLAQLH